jgi:hypothetical protein
MTNAAANKGMLKQKKATMLRGVVLTRQGKVLTRPAKFVMIA